jgi:Reverse transcriptase (RNA-dependent DNA polymerase)
MKTSIRKYRLVLACIKWTGSLMNLIAALVNMASNYAPLVIPKWIGRFEVKPNRWVYHPTEDTLKIGKKIKADVAKAWSAPAYYFHLRSGGHMAALRSHSTDKMFVHLDLTDFFGSVGQTRITRCLKSRLGYVQARWIAKESTVEHPGGKGARVLPYGFPQSAILASIALFDSKLGRLLHKFANSGSIHISVYVDDIILSCNNAEILSSCVEDIRRAAERSRFSLNEAKTQGPSLGVRAFNIDIAHLSMQVAPDRLALFREAVLESTNYHRTDAIVKYVKIVNQMQGDALEADAAAAQNPLGAKRPI